MKRLSGASWTLALAVLGAAPPVKPTPVPRAKSHAHTVEGRVVSVTPHHAFVVRTSTGTEATLVLTGATHLSGGDLAPGGVVTARYLAREGRKVATSVRVEPAPGATPTAAALESP
jgi:hypothetical protein